MLYFHTALALSQIKVIKQCQAVVSKREKRANHGMKESPNP